MDERTRALEQLYRDRYVAFRNTLATVGRATTVKPVEGVILVPLATSDRPTGVAGHDVDGRDVFSIPLPPKPFEDEG